jgi:hypothetical protein
MSQPSASGRGAGAEPGRGRELPGGSPAADSGPRGDRELRLGDFAKGGAGDAFRPGPALAAAVAALSGPDWSCAGATDDELIGLLGRWSALESWAAAGKLGVIRELIRRRARPGLDGSLPMHGDLPDLWEEGLGHEVSAALQVSLRAADMLVALAWDLQARLPGIAAALAAGIISPLKAQIVSDELSVLDDEDAAAAEKLILDQLADQTPGQVGKLAAQTACTVDPDGAAKRRQMAEREQARVRFWRENGGACALAAYGLPTDAALAANAAINDRAEEYKKTRVRPGARMDQLRVLAFLDILNGITLQARAEAEAAQRASAAQPENAEAARRAEGRPDDGGPVGAPVGGPVSGMPGAPGPDAVLPALTARANLTVPLATLLGLAKRPGAGHGLGPLDPALARDLAASAAGSPHSQWCVTITDAQGLAIGHGCARLGRPTRADSPVRTSPARTTKANRANSPPTSRAGPSAGAPWAFAPRDAPGPAEGYGTWTLTLPGGRELTVKLGPVPVTECDHRHESQAYQPGDTLRHLVQVRDGECSFPTCSRHARESDFEHAVPYDKGGRTCACNGSARSRRCHKVKQSRGWTVTQPRPGWHQWKTPAGRTYTQGPMRYPA